MQRRGEEGCEGGGKKSFILMDACIGCDKISPIYHSNVPDFTVFINSSLSCVICFLWLPPPFFDAMTESVVILTGWLAVIISSPPYHTHIPFLTQPSTAMCRCARATACQVHQWNDKVLLYGFWHVICLHPRLAAVSSKTHTTHF